MKTLQLYAVIAEDTNIDIFNTIIHEFKDITVVYETTIEEAINTFNKQNFDLLIIDKALPREVYNKLDKLAHMLHPDAAKLGLHFMDEYFIRFKMSELMANWLDAQAENRINFLDNPPL